MEKSQMRKQAGGDKRRPLGRRRILPDPNRPSLPEAPSYSGKYSVVRREAKP